MRLHDLTERVGTARERERLIGELRAAPYREPGPDARARHATRPARHDPGGRGRSARRAVRAAGARRRAGWTDAVAIDGVAAIEALQASPDRGFLPKPWDPPPLIAAVRRGLGELT
jgi:hypothetical protein